MGVAAGGPRPAEKAGIAPASLRFDGARALEEVDAFLVAGGGPRPAGSEANARGRAHVAERLRRFGPVEEGAFEYVLPEGSLAARAPGWVGRFRPGERVSLTNLFLDLPGASREVVLLACHHDSVPRSPGAEDDASGVGVLLEIAAALEGRSLARTVRLAFFDGEELGLVGSRRYARDLPAPEREAIVAAIALEMVGWKEGIPTLHFFRSLLYEGAPVPSSDLLQRILDAASRGGARLAVGDPFPGMTFLYQSILRTARPPLGSDEGPFAEIGVPAALVAASSFTRFYPDYHRETDALDRLDPRTLERAGRALEAAVLELAKAPRVDASGTVDLLVRSRRIREPWLRALVAIAAATIGAAAVERPRAPAERAAALGAGACLLAGAALPRAFDLPFLLLATPAALLASLAAARGRAARSLLAAAGLLPALLFVGFLLAMHRAYRGSVGFDPDPVAAGGSAAATLLATASAWPRRRSREP